MSIIHTMLRVWIMTLCCIGITYGQPKLHVVGGVSFDFGNVYSPSVSKILTIQNLGRDTLTILNVGTSCGCTAALASEDHIPPGDSGTVSITFDAKRFSGKVEKLVSLTTNDTSQRYVAINFTANVIKTLEFDPEYFFFSVPMDSVTTKELTVTNGSSQPIRILSTKTSSDIITITWDKDKIESGEDAILKATVTLPRRGTYRGSIRITTDHPIHPVFMLTYFALGKDKK